MQEEVQRARDLIKTIRHAAMATVNKDGSPHNTPYFFMHDPGLTKLYWGSHKNSQHSKNVSRNPKIFVVLFDSYEQGKGGVYFTANDAHELSGDEFNAALQIHNQFRAKYGKDPLSMHYYTHSGQRLYAARIQKVEIYHAERNEQGLIKEETRQEIDTTTLIDGGKDA